MSGSQVNPNAKFGTLPVFLTALSTILGAILFLRFGWAVGQLGFYGVMGIIVLGHLVTIPTAMAVAEIATNQKVQGGGHITSSHALLVLILELPLAWRCTFRRPLVLHFMLLHLAKCLSLFRTNTI